MREQVWRWSVVSTTNEQAYLKRGSLTLIGCFPSERKPRNYRWAKGSMRSAPSTEQNGSCPGVVLDRKEVTLVERDAVPFYGFASFVGLNSGIVRHTRAGGSSRGRSGGDELRYSTTQIAGTETVSVFRHCSLNRHNLSVRRGRQKRCVPILNRFFSSVCQVLRRSRSIGPSKSQNS